MARSFTKSNNMDYSQAGYTSRNLNGYILAHSTLGSWIQFYHQPYKCDWNEAMIKAIERKEKEEGKTFYIDNVLNKQINSKFNKKKEDE